MPPTTFPLTHTCALRVVMGVIGLLGCARTTGTTAADAASVLSDVALTDALTPDAPPLDAPPPDVSAPSCLADAACTPSDPCHHGVIGCSVADGGTQITRCVDLGLVPPGTRCGPDQECLSTGVCFQCLGLGTPCDTGSPCSAGVIDCVTGDPVCHVVSHQAVGTPCGDGGVCLPSGSCGMAATP